VKILPPFYSMKIGLMTVSHKRPDIDKCYCLMVDRLRNDYPDLFLPVCVVSLEEDKKVFEEHGIETYLYKNEPLGEKHNFAIKKLRDRCTHVLHMGSDDVIDNTYVDQIIKYADYDYVWGLGLMFYSVRQKRIRFWEGANKNLGGPGKLVRAELLNKVDWHIWNDKLNCGLDKSCFEILTPHVQTVKRFSVAATKCMLLDIKSDMNINPYHLFMYNGKEIGFQYIVKRISKVESEYLESLN